MKHGRVGFGVASVLVWGSAILATSTKTPPPAQTATPAPTTPARVSYEQQVRPILVENCLDCHSQDKRKGGLSLATYADVLDGGKDGPIVRPGNGATSLLIHRITGLDGEQMPKDGGPPPPPPVVAMPTRWLDGAEGAPPPPPPPPPPGGAPRPAGRRALPAFCRRRGRPLPILRRRIPAQSPKRRVAPGV